MALYSLFKLTVLCALFQATAAQSCTGTLTVANSPIGEYAATKINVGMGEVKRVAFNFSPITNVGAAVQYTQHLTGCVFDRTMHPPKCNDFEGTTEDTFQNGRFEDDAGNRGSLFIPTPPASGTRKFDINALLNIHWCPNENYFQVTVAGQGPYILPSQYFLADGGKSCSKACADRSNNACNLRAITSAASSVARCRDVVSSLGMSFTKSGMYRDDDAGCTYHPGQTGWAQVMNSGRDSGATPAPTCDEVNRDRSRRRVCACTSQLA